MSQSAIAFVESNTSGTGRLFIHSAARMGYRPVILVSDPGRYPYLNEVEIDILKINTQDYDEVLRVCRRIKADRAGLSGVTSSSEYFIETASTVARELKLPGPSPESIRICRDKFLQR